MVSILVIVGWPSLSLGQKISPRSFVPEECIEGGTPPCPFHRVKDETIPIVRAFSKRLPEPEAESVPQEERKVRIVVPRVQGGERVNE